MPAGRRRLVLAVILLPLCAGCGTQAWPAAEDVSPRPAAKGKALKEPRGVYPLNERLRELIAQRNEWLARHEAAKRELADPDADHKARDEAMRKLLRAEQRIGVLVDYMRLEEKKQEKENKDLAWNRAHAEKHGPRPPSSETRILSLKLDKESLRAEIERRKGRLADPDLAEEPRKRIADGIRGLEGTYEMLLKGMKKEEAMWGGS